MRALTRARAKNLIKKMKDETIVKEKKKTISKVKIMPRHKRILQREMSVNVGSDRDAERKERYKESYVKSGHLKNTKSWKTLSEKKLNNELLIETNLWLINLRRKGSKWWQAVNAGLDKAYKARKIYTNGHDDNGGGTDEASDQQVEDRISAIISGAIRAVVASGKTEGK